MAVVVTIGYFDANGMKDECVISPPTDSGSSTASRTTRIQSALALIDSLSPVWLEASPAALQTAIAAKTKIPVGRPSDWDSANCTLDVEASTLTFNDETAVNVAWLYFVIDRTTGESLQWSTATGNVVTLVDLPSDVQDTDSVYVDYRPVSQ